MYAVIFTAKVNELDENYSLTAQKMRELAFSKYGCQSFNAVTEGVDEIAVSYWQSLEAIQRWKNDIEHLAAQTLGKQKWYACYQVDIAHIERSYAYSK